MEKRINNAAHGENDRRLDTPGEANTEKHINFLELEEEGGNRNSSNQVDDFAEERRRQWQEGIAEGKKAREEENS
jgi:hypothetical protein